MSTSQATDYTKLTVVQLKTLCKDRKITGYSKLSKPALVQKLVDADGLSSAAALPPACLAISAAVQNEETGTNSFFHIRAPSVLNVSSEEATLPIDQIKSSVPPDPSDKRLASTDSTSRISCDSAQVISRAQPTVYQDSPPSINTRKTASSPCALAASSVPLKRVVDTPKASTTKRPKTKVDSMTIPLKPPIPLKSPVLRPPVSMGAITSLSCTANTPLHQQTVAISESSITAAPISKLTKRFKPLVARQVGRPPSDLGICAVGGRVFKLIDTAPCVWLTYLYSPDPIPPSPRRQHYSRPLASSFGHRSSSLGSSQYLCLPHYRNENESKGGQ